jgi:non-homologous end joining protein Ku
MKLEDFDSAYLEDRYRTVLVSMLKEKSATMPPRANPAAPSQKNVIDLMAMLKKSLQVERPASEKGLKSRRAAAAVSKTVDAKRSKRVQE